MRKGHFNRREPLSFTQRTAKKSGNVKLRGPLRILSVLCVKFFNLHKNVN
jgi:hypothetical protein